MFAFKFMLLANAIAMFVIAGAIVMHDVMLCFRSRQLRSRGVDVIEAEPVRMRTVVAFILIAWLPLLVALGLAVLPASRAS